MFFLCLKFVPMVSWSFVFFQLRSSVWFLRWNTRRWTKMKWWVTLQSKRAQLLCRTQPQASRQNLGGFLFEEIAPFLSHTYQQHQKGCQMVLFGQVSIHHWPFKLGYKDTTTPFLEDPGPPVTGSLHVTVLTIWLVVGQAQRWRWQLQCLVQQLKVGAMANTQFLFPQICRSLLHWLWQVRTQDVVVMVDGHEFEDIYGHFVFAQEKHIKTHVFFATWCWHFGCFLKVFHGDPPPQNLPGVGSDYVKVSVDEDQSCNSERSHTSEIMSVCAFAGPCVLWIHDLLSC